MADCDPVSMVSRVPLIVVLGATGVGKSKLGIELAKRFNGEVISADSMQVYKGLDIITNKVTAEEADGVPHHMMDFLDPLAKYTVVDFRNAALKIVENLLEAGKAAVVVGGTNYYIESLLWRTLVEEPGGEGASALVGDKPRIAEGGLPLSGGARARVEAGVAAWAVDHLRREVDKMERIHENRSTADMSPMETRKATLEREAAALEAAGRRLAVSLGAADRGGPEAVLETLQAMDDAQAAQVLAEAVSWSGSAEAALGRAAPGKLPLLRSLRLHRQLRILDPEMADSLHPNDTRKIIRSLEVVAQKGRPHSQVLEEQRSQEGGSHLGGPLRFPDSVVFWLLCDTEILNKRLDDRVDDMIKKGLVNELTDFHEKYNANRLNRGDRSAAYTEGIFQSIGFKEFHEYLVLDDEKKASREGVRLLEAGIEALKLVTRRYAKRQAKWIRNRLLNPPGRTVPPVVKLDTSDPSSWERDVLGPAIAAVLDPPPPRVPPPSSPAPSPLGRRTSFHCQVCKRVFVGDLQWEAHLRSKKHKAMLKRKREA